MAAHAWLLRARKNVQKDWTGSMRKADLIEREKADHLGGGDLLIGKGEQKAALFVQLGMGTKA